MKSSEDAAEGVLFFATPADLRRWFKANHARTREQWIGYYKKASGRPSITWPESVDEALCVGWIDGIRKGIDAESYKTRFTPRKPISNWSAVNIARVAELTRTGRMQPAGLAAFARRVDDRSVIYAYENRASAKLSAPDQKRFRACAAAWSFFEKQPAGYRALAIWRVISAKQPATRERRLARLISESEAGRRT